MAVMRGQVRVAWLLEESEKVGSCRGLNPGHSTWAVCALPLRSNSHYSWRIVKAGGGSVSGRALAAQARCSGFDFQ